MTPKSIAAGLLLGAAAVLAATSAQAGPAVTTQWTETTLTQEECLERAENAVGKAGFGQLERVGQSRFGTRGDYTASIRCVADKNLVFFVVAGPSRDQAPRLMKGLYESF
jgi:hypothetical protein